MTRYLLPGSTWSIDVPAAWAREDGHGTATFRADEATITVSAAPRAAPPTVASVRAEPVAVTGPDTPTELVVRDARPGAHDAIEATGRVAGDAFDTYVFWNRGVQIMVTLTHPSSSGTPESWNAVISSFATTS